LLVSRSPNRQSCGGIKIKITKKVKTSELGAVVLNETQEKRPDTSARLSKSSKS
jgi:hypothetical protein